MTQHQPHVAIIGAGIVGLAHAWAAARAGYRVTVFERSDKARGASVRNFGMCWPIGQPFEHFDLALRSRELWTEFTAATGAYVRPTGSVHVVTHDDEAAVLEEFVAAAAGTSCRVSMLTAAQVGSDVPGVRKGVAKAGMLSRSEMNLDPREALALLPSFLKERHDVRFHWNTAVVHVGEGKLRTAAGETHAFDEAYVCSGHDFETLFPEILAASPLKPCKLQMMRTVPQPDGWKMGPMLASGLTLRQYSSFHACPSLAAVKARVAREMPELDLYGIHVMASQDRFGGIVLGDSHEYGSDIEIFDKTEIDELMLRELRKLYDFPDWTIAERWHGIYAKHFGGIEYRVDALPGVQIATGTSGSGMTMSFGLADRHFATRAAKQCSGAL